MAGLRELRARLKSVRTTGQLSNAMKTVSTAKYSKVNAIRAGYRDYADTCRDMAAMTVDAFGSNPSQKTLYVVLAGNRGLCGVYNSELLKIFEESLIADDGEGKEYEVITCGKRASEYAREHGIKNASDFPMPDVPEYGDAEALAGKIIERFDSGEVGRVVIVYRKFKNMLTQIPTFYTLLPISDAGGKDEIRSDETIYVPDKKSVAETLKLEYLRTLVYGTMLDCASGVQASTMMSMRTAADNARELSESLELEINRRRQSEVTASVIENVAGTYTEE